MAMATETIAVRAAIAVTGAPSETRFLNLMTGNLLVNGTLAT
jgi:hypothetical protein